MSDLILDCRPVSFAPSFAGAGGTWVRRCGERPLAASPANGKHRRLSTPSGGGLSGGKGGGLRTSIYMFMTE